MRIADVLAHKGSGLVTILPTDTIDIAARVMAAKNIGALVVLDYHDRLSGLLTERDIGPALADRGPSALALTVADLMTPKVTTCTKQDTIKAVMAMMPLHRFRHVPVVDDAGHLQGIVSIGDIVKHRLEERDSELAILRDINIVHAQEAGA